MSVTRGFLLWILLLGLGASAEAQNYEVIYGFTGGDGAEPFAGLVEGTDGALYGTTSDGGPILFPYGTVFRINKDGTGFLKLHGFNGSDGGGPFANLIEGSDGAFYGTTLIGGVHGPGVVFKVSKDGTG